MVSAADASLTRRRRGYVPTPAKFLLAVLVMQGVLFLSSHYRWFWVNEQRSFAALVAVIASTAVVLLLVSFVLVSRFFKSKAQFGLSTLFLMVLVVAMPFGWWAREVELARRQAVLDRQLIVACHRLDVDGVVRALTMGADVNGRFGDGDSMVFRNPWTLGWPISAHDWTSLIAVASSYPYPPPPREVKNTIEDLDRAEEELKKIPAAEIAKRNADAVTIALVLLSHGARINDHDDRGATALYEAVYGDKVELVKLLLRFDADVNTKTGIYIDGPGDLTPLHQAFRSEELTKLLLEKGADPNAKTTDGETAGDWVKRDKDLEELEKSLLKSLNIPKEDLKSESPDSDEEWESIE